MDILELIKKRTSIRKYKNKKIPNRIIDKIVEAGIWGPSIHGIQPWKFIIIKNSSTIENIKDIVITEAKRIKIPSFILIPTAKALINAILLICVFNTKKFSNFARKVNKDCVANADTAELSAISASIQNMLLIGHNLGIGSCWLDTALFCKDKISTICHTSNDLVAVISFGYPAEKGKRAPRILINEKVKYLK